MEQVWRSKGYQFMLKSKKKQVKNALTFWLWKPVIAKKADVIESAKRDLIFLAGVELSVLHIWNVWAGVVTFLLHSHRGVIVHKGAEPILRVWENQLRDPDVLLLCGWQSIQASVLFQVEKGQSVIIKS